MVDKAAVGCRIFFIFMFVFMFVFVCTAASAQDTVTLDSVDLYATMRSVSVTALFSGDANANAVAHVEWRPRGGPAFSAGHPLVRLPGSRFVGSVLFVSPGMDYDVRVVADDPDNGAPVTLDASITTRPNAPELPLLAGTTWFVDGALGFDANPGTAALPFATIQAGADAARPGDVVRVRPGVYYEQVVPPRGGAPGAPIWFVADGNGVIIDGSDPAITAGAPWTDAGGGLFWTPFAAETIYVAVDDTRIYDYQFLADLQAENGNIGVPGAIPGGFFVDAAAGRLYVVTPDHTSPAAHEIHVAVRGSAFLLDTLSDVVIEGFEMRYFGAASGYGGVGIDIRDSSRCWVRFNRIHHVNSAVRVRRALASENVIERNSFRDTGVWTWPWDSSKSHTPEASAVSVTSGHGNVVRWNDMEGSFNGIYTGDFSDPDEEIARDTDVYENRLRFHRDDGLELEGAQRNVRYWENIVRDGYNMISIAPIEAGPVFFVRNVIWNYAWHVVKANNATHGFVFLYHTTSLPYDGGLFPDNQAIEPPETVAGLTTRNNIFEANRYVIEYGLTSLAGPVDLDVDDLYTHDTEGAGRFVKWLNVRYSDLASLQASGTIEQNGFAVLPAYEAAASGDFTLTAGHALVDAGVVIPGINDRAFAGAAPDVGAFERLGKRPGPDPEDCDVLRSDRAPELPWTPDTRFRNVRLPFTDPDAVLSNPALPALLFYQTTPAAAPVLAVKDTGSVRLSVAP